MSVNNHENPADELTPYGWFSELSGNDKERWITEKNTEVE